MMRWLDAWFYSQIAIWATLFRRLDVAIEYWQRVRRIKPNDVVVVATLSHLKARVGAKAEAVALMHQALDMNREQPAIWFNLGFVQQEMEAHEDALKSFRQALDRDSRLDRAWYGLALSLMKLGRTEEAVDALKKNTELQPMSPYGWYQLAHAYHRLGNAAQAEKVIRNLAKFEPKVAMRLEHETGIKVGANVPF
ncbi:MAG: tetratricopeptide repeat protein [Rhodospirillales bacterium]|nr:tetratricopeptide repeat protein [Rhodospirillales bacterium]